MKKYRYCFFLCAAFAVVVLGILVWQFAGNRKEALPPAKETVPLVTESETVSEDRIVLNQERVMPVSEDKGKSQEKKPEEKKEYLLVSEDGFLLVFGNNAKEICLYTHIPISDFPEDEREKLREGIWFSRMEEIYSYLESYTS